MKWYEAQTHAAVQSYDFGTQDDDVSSFDFESGSGLGRFDYANATGSNLGPDGAGADTDAEPDSWAVVTEARRVGYEDGFRAGVNAARDVEKRLSSQLKRRLQKTMDMLSAFELRIEENVRTTTVKLAAALASRIIDTELRSDPETLFAIAGSSLKDAVGLGDVVLYSHPDAVEALRARQAELKQLHPDGANVTVKPDTNLEFGSCRVVSNSGEIDNSLNERLARLVQVIEERMVEQAAVATPIASAPESETPGTTASRARATGAYQSLNDEVGA